LGASSFAVAAGRRRDDYDVDGRQSPRDVAAGTVGRRAAPPPPPPPTGRINHIKPVRHGEDG